MAFTAAERKRAEEIAARYPHSKSALIPLLHMVQERDGWVTPQGMDDVADFLGLTPAIVLGTCSFYTMLKREPVGRLIVSVCTSLACMVNGGPDLLSGLTQRYAADPDVTVEEVECIAHCDRAPALQVNYDFNGPLDVDGAAALIEQYKSGELTARTISGTRPGAVVGSDG
jgi:NADH:ubiquinone oxidoreductase subunit E